MHSPYGLDVSENCVGCAIRSPGHFCQFDRELLESFETLKYATVYPKGAVLFVEGQSPRGVFMLCNGRVKLTTCSSDGKAIISRIAEAGEVLGLSASVSDRPYMATAETLIPCQVNFIRRDDFLRSGRSGAGRVRSPRRRAGRSTPGWSPGSRDCATLGQRRRRGLVDRPEAFRDEARW